MLFPFEEYIKICPKKYFPATPCPILQTSSKFVVLSQLDKGSCKFSPLFVRLSVDLLSPLDGFKQMPYNIFWHSVQSDFKNRICAIYIYFISHNSVQMHRHFVYGKTAQDHRESKVRLQQLTAKSKWASLHCAPLWNIIWACQMAQRRQSRCECLNISGTFFVCSPDASNEEVAGKPVDRGAVIQFTCFLFFYLT